MIRGEVKVGVMGGGRGGGSRGVVEGGDEG